MEERELINRIKSGDKEAFKVMVDKYSRIVFNICNGFLHNTMDAEDVSQEVFTEVFLSSGKFRGDSKISTWLYRIAVNKSLNHLRDNKKIKKIKSLSPDLSNDFSANVEIPADRSQQSDYPIENSDRRKNLFSAINSLPENQKTAFILNKYEDLSYKEISEVMDLTIPSVESLLFRAKKSLQEKLIECYKKL